MGHDLMSNKNPYAVMDSISLYYLRKELGYDCFNDFARDAPIDPDRLYEIEEESGALTDKERSTLMKKWPQAYHHAFIEKKSA